MSTYAQYPSGYFHGKPFKRGFSDAEKLFLRVSDATSLLSPYYHHFLRMVASLPQGGKVLDIGIANGVFAHFLHLLRPDLTIVGLDITDVSDLLPDYIDLQVADATNFDLGETYDLIMANHLIEHLTVADVPKLLGCVKKHLSDEGLFWFTVPSVSYGFWNDPTHIRPYTQEAITRMARMCDLCTHDLHEGYYFRYPIRFFKFSKFRITYGWMKA